MSLAQRMHFLLDVFEMTAITLVSVINHYHINGLHLFWDNLYKIVWCSAINKVFDWAGSKQVMKPFY